MTTWIVVNDEPDTEAFLASHLANQLRGRGRRWGTWLLENETRTYLATIERMRHPSVGRWCQKVVERRQTALEPMKLIWSPGGRSRNLHGSGPNGAWVWLKGTKKGALACVTSPKPFRVTGFPNLDETIPSIYAIILRRQVSYNLPMSACLRIQSKPWLTVLLKAGNVGSSMP